MKWLRLIANFVLKGTLILIATITILYSAIWFDSTRSLLCNCAASIVTIITGQKTEIKNVRVYGYIIPNFYIEKITIGNFFVRHTFVSPRCAGLDIMTGYFELNIENKKKETVSTGKKDKNIHELIDKFLTYSKIFKLVFRKVLSTSTKGGGSKDIAGKIFINGDCITVSSYSYDTIDGVCFSFYGNAKDNSSFSIWRWAKDKYTDIECTNFLGNTFSARINDIDDRTYFVDLKIKKILGKNFNTRLTMNASLNGNHIAISECNIESHIFVGSITATGKDIKIDGRKLVGNFVFKTPILSELLTKSLYVGNQGLDAVEFVVSGEANFFDGNNCKFSLNNEKASLLSGTIEFGRLLNINNEDILISIDKIPEGIKIADIKTKKIDQISVRFKQPFKEIESHVKIGDTMIDTELEIQDGKFKLKQFEANGPRLECKTDKKKTSK